MMGIGDGQAGSSQPGQRPPSLLTPPRVCSLPLPRLISAAAFSPSLSCPAQFTFHMAPNRVLTFTLLALLLLTAPAIVHCLLAGDGASFTGLHEEEEKQVSSSLAAGPGLPPPLLAPSQIIDCGSECKRRCSKASRRDRCTKYCLICCGKCHCVPPGTFGNKEMCPCYNNLKNSKGTSKCP